MNRLKILALLGFLSLAPLVAGQLDEQESRKGKFYLVPELWLSFGSSTYIDIAPMAGYHVSDRLSVGLGPHYIFQSQNANYMIPESYSTHIFGGKAFSRFSVIRHAEEFLPINLFSELFIHVEYEALSLEYKYFGNLGDPTDGRFIYNSYLIGGGLTQRVGMYSSISFMVLWNLNESINSPYSNPIFRIGFNAYL